MFCFGLLFNGVRGVVCPPRKPENIQNSPWKNLCERPKEGVRASHYVIVSAVSKEGKMCSGGGSVGYPWEGLKKSKKCFYHIYVKPVTSSIHKILLQYFLAK